MRFGTKNNCATAADGRKKSIGSRRYYDAIKEILKGKQIPSNHYTHLGRILGSANLQFRENDNKDIRQLGNWQVTICDLAYSTKLPLKAMRAAAGHINCDGMFFCPRCTVEPPELLKKQYFSFADEQLQLVNEEILENGQDKGGNYLGTAKCFLQMLIRLRTIILQDAAAMQVVKLERCRSHPLFVDFAHIFRTPEFKVSDVFV